MDGRGEPHFWVVDEVKRVLQGSPFQKCQRVSTTTDFIPPTVPKLILRVLREKANIAGSVLRGALSMSRTCRD